MARCSRCPQKVVPQGHDVDCQACGNVFDAIGGDCNDSCMVQLSRNSVTETPAAPSADALAHFESLLAFETGCWDVRAAGTGEDKGFVLLDVRSPELYATGHVPGAINLPHGRINERNVDEHPTDTLFVVYCAGPHCNGADKAARKLALLGRPVKKMIGGVTGWLDEGFELLPG